MDKRDCKMFMKSRGYTSDEASEDFKAKVRVGHDGDGEGGARKLWIAKNLKRIKDRKRFVSSAVEEGSKAMKAVKFQDARALKDFCYDSQASFGNSFLRDAGKQGRCGEYIVGGTCGSGRLGRGSLWEPDAAST